MSGVKRQGGVATPGAPGPSQEPQPLRIVITTGIFPPDIGGPATHAADLADELRRRGHEVTVLTLGEGSDPEHGAGIVRYPRAWGWPRWHAATLQWLLAHRRAYDVIYATGIHEVAVLAGHLSGRPVVAKAVCDPAWERACRRGLTQSSFEEFQRYSGGGGRVWLLRMIRNATFRGAAVVMAPSRHLVGAVGAWLGDAREATLGPNGVRLGGIPARQPVDRPAGQVHLVSVGRLISSKRLDLVLQGLALTTEVTLEVVGDGPAENDLRRLARTLNLDGRVQFLGRLPHPEVLRRLAQADALVSTSDHEGLPHVAIEALACGTPIVARPAGGLAEVVTDGTTGLVLGDHPGDVAAACNRLRDPALRERLSLGARQAAQSWSLESCAEQILAVLRDVTAPRPRVVFLEKGPEKGPASESDVASKRAILERYVDPVVVTTGSPGRRSGGDATTRALPRVRPGLANSALFYGVGPALALAQTARSGPRGIVCQSPYEAAGTVALSWMLPRSLRPRIVVEVHGDWRTAARLYGGSVRRPLAPLADRVATWALRRADQVRVVGDFTEGLVRAEGYRGPVDRYVAYSDYNRFLDPDPEPFPDQPRALFVGALEDYKGVDVLLNAWAALVRRSPQSHLVIVGSGTRGDNLKRQAASLGLSGAVTFAGQISRAAIIPILDRAAVLVLPSRSEGLGRVIIEAHARGRPVVASRVGGIPELVEHGRNGLLVEPEDPSALAEALARILGDAKLQQDLGAYGRRTAQARHPIADFEAGIARLSRFLQDRRARGSP